MPHWILLSDITDLITWKLHCQSESWCLSLAWGPVDLILVLMMQQERGVVTNVSLGSHYGFDIQMYLLQLFASLRLLFLILENGGDTSTLCK